jgi:hypothetical protein
MAQDNMPAAPVQTTPVSVTPCPTKSAFGVAPVTPAKVAGGPWVAIGRDAPASNAELARREAGKYAPPKGKR